MFLLKKINLNKVFCILFLAIIFLGLINIIAIPVLKKVYSKITIDSKIALDELDIKNVTTNNNVNLENSSNTYINLLKKIKSKIDNFSKQRIPFRMELVDLNGFYELSLGKKLFRNEVLLLKNNYLSRVNPIIDMNEPANKLIEFNNFLKNHNIPLIYIQAPHKVAKKNKMSPEFFEYYPNESADELIYLIKNSINYIDISEQMKLDKINMYDYFFKTDHHWKPEGAFYAFQKVAVLLKRDYNFVFNEKILDLNNYNIKTYNDWFLGSEGKKTGTYISDIDDISIITPKFDTNITFSIPSKNIELNGNWSTTLLKKENIETKDLFNKSPYSVYKGANYKLDRVLNHDSIDNKKILLIGDSFTLPFSSFLSLLGAQVDTIDLRRYSDEIFSLETFVNETNPDIVLVLYYPGSFSNKYTFNFK